MKREHNDDDRDEEISKLIITSSNKYVLPKDKGESTKDDTDES